MTDTRATISVIIVAMNEAHDIGDCLASVRDWATEMIVFDSGSTDGTQDICRSYGARVFETDWPGDGPQKNRALERAFDVPIPAEIYEQLAAELEVLGDG